MENKKEYCEMKIERWHNLQGKLPKAQRIMPGGTVSPASITPEEMEELDNIEKKLKENCLEYLSLEDAHEIKGN